MDSEKAKQKLLELIQLPSEIEWVEFKTAKDDYNADKLGKYFSSLSNEANLNKQEFGWMILGIDNNRNIIGTEYRKNGTLNSLKKEISDHTTCKHTFKEIYELKIDEKRVILFQIPRALDGIPVAWKGHYYGREHESQGALSLQKFDQIRYQNKKTDWSAMICEKATPKDLDTTAIIKAKEQYKKKHPNLAIECDKWDNWEFLNRVGLTIKDKITRAAIVLLGNSDSIRLISPYTIEITWSFEGEKGIRDKYEHFSPPFILNTDKILARINNEDYIYMPDSTLFPEILSKYDTFVIREALHNCIAHQDYEFQEKINIVEKVNELTFVNAGTFIPGDIDNLINSNLPPGYYRNKLLSGAMAELNMIDEVGTGIRRMFEKQRDRFFPLPDYDLSNQNKVIVTIEGKVIDKKYTKLLQNSRNIDLRTVILLDKVQKRKQISKGEFLTLKKIHLIEGRYPNIYIADKVAQYTQDQGSYIKNRAFDNEYYKKLVLEYLKTYKQANRNEINTLLIDKISDALAGKQKLVKISNILNEMSNKDKTIKNIGSDRKSKWVMSKKYK